MTAPTIPPATTPADDGDNAPLRAEIAREAALGSDGQVAALSLALRLITRDDAVATEADYPEWDPQKRVVTTPKRIQRKRTKGWRKPEGAVIVSRPSRFGNPFTLAGAIEWAGAESPEQARKICVTAFRSWVRGNNEFWMGPKAEKTRQRLLDGLPELKGHDLACFCPADQPCHADVLLEIANGGESRG